MKLAGKQILLLLLAVLGLFLVVRLFRSPVKSTAGASQSSLKVGETEVTDSR